jgi:hypothetical protein
MLSDGRTFEMPQNPGVFAAKPPRSRPGCSQSGLLLGETVASTFAT